MSGWKDLAPPFKSIRLISCGKDWVTDTDTTLTIDKLRGFSMSDDGVHIYSAEKDIHGDYDNVFVPYSNLHAMVFYFNESNWKTMPVIEKDDAIL